MRTVIAVILSVLLGIFCFLSQRNLTSVSANMQQQTEQAENLIEKGDISQAVKRIKDMENEWVSEESRLAIYINHDLLEDIGVSIASLRGLAKVEDKSLFYSAAEELKTKFIHIKDINSLSYRNFI